MNYLIIILCIILAVIGITFIFIDLKRKEALKKEIEIYNKAEKKLNKIDEILRNIESIAKSEEIRSIYNMYISKCKDLRNTFLEYGKAIDDLRESNSINKLNEFKNQQEYIHNTFDKLIYDIEKLYTDVDLYSRISTDNENVCITAKSKLKEVQGLFERYLQVHEVFNDDFATIISKYNNKFIQFNEFQTKSEFNKARRLILELCDEINILKEYITTFSTLLTILEIKIPSLKKNIETIIEQINEEGYALNNDKIVNQIEEIENQRTSLMDALFKTRLKDINLKALSRIKNEIDDLKTISKEMLEKINDQYQMIKKLKNLDTEINKQIQEITNIFDLALKEVESIRHKYNVNSTDQMSQIEKLYEDYKNFLVDYNKLNELIHSGKENYDNAIECTEKANKFLKLVLQKLSAGIRELGCIRYDEQLGRETLEKYKKSIIEIELYLRRNDHFFDISKSLSNQLNEGKNLYLKLEEEVNAEKISISKVSDLTEKVNECFKKILGNEESKSLLEIDIIRKIGCKRLIMFLGRSSDDFILSQLVKANNLFEAKEYTKCYNFIFEILSKNSSNGEKVFHQVLDTKTIIVEKFKSVLLEEVK